MQFQVKFTHINLKQNCVTEVLHLRLFVNKESQVSKASVAVLAFKMPEIKLTPTGTFDFGTFDSYFRMTFSPKAK